jgi:hypothetical protein
MDSSVMQMTASSDCHSENHLPAAQWVLVGAGASREAPSGPPRPRGSPNSPPTPVPTKPVHRHCRLSLQAHQLLQVQVALLPQATLHASADWNATGSCSIHCFKYRYHFFSNGSAYSLPSVQCCSQWLAKHVTLAGIVTLPWRYCLFHAPLGSIRIHLLFTPRDELPARCSSSFGLVLKVEDASGIPIVPWPYCCTCRYPIHELLSNKVVVAVVVTAVAVVLQRRALLTCPRNESSSNHSDSQRRPVIVSRCCYYC